PIDSVLNSLSAEVIASVVIQNNDIYRIYAPYFVEKFKVRVSTKPDIVVDSIDFDNGELVMNLMNIGIEDVTSTFWVDMFVNPQTLPTQPNDTLEWLNEVGYVWGVADSALPIRSGETLTLRLDGPYFSTVYSTYSDALKNGDQIVVHVDSANTGSDFGAVLESHEDTGGTYNNIYSLEIQTAMPLEPSILLNPGEQRSLHTQLPNR
ncbi:MAG: hypothetical protein AAGD96_13420, partial [Chloroflexota bacterium]